GIASNRISGEQTTFCGRRAMLVDRGDSRPRPVVQSEGFRLGNRRRGGGPCHPRPEQQPYDVLTFGTDARRGTGRRGRATQARVAAVDTVLGPRPVSPQEYRAAVADCQLDRAVDRTPHEGLDATRNGPRPVRDSAGPERPRDRRGQPSSSAWRLPNGPRPAT